MSAERDLYNNLKLEEILAAAAPGTGDTNSSEIDTQGTHSLLVEVNSAAPAAGTFKLQHSDTSGSGFVDAPAADVLGSQGVTLVNGEATKLGYVGSKRYVIAVLSLSADGVVGANAISNHSEICPVE